MAQAPSLSDAPMGPKQVRSTVLTLEEEAVVVAFRRHTLLPLDDCLYALQPTIPHLTRSSLHRCLQRHGISRLPEVAGNKPAKRSSRPIRSATSTSTSPRCTRKRGGSTCSWPLIAPASSPFAQLHEKATRRVAADFLRALIAAVPYKIHTVLTDNGTQFHHAGQHQFGSRSDQRGHGTRRDLPRSLPSSTPVPRMTLIIG